MTSKWRLAVIWAYLLFAAWSIMVAVAILTYWFWGWLKGQF